VIDDRHGERLDGDAGGEVELSLDRVEIVGIDRGALAAPALDAFAERDVTDLRGLTGVAALDRDHGLTGVLVHRHRRGRQVEATRVVRGGVRGGGTGCDRRRAREDERDKHQC
jgi:hypothetical protein